HLAAQTRGRFQDPSFMGLGPDDLTEVTREVRTLAPAAPGEPQYEAVDFGAALAGGTPPRGLFQLRVSGWDPAKKERIGGARDRRIVLVTDLGLLVKDGHD